MAILKLIIWPLISLPLAIDPAIELAWIPLLQCTALWGTIHIYLLDLQTLLKFYLCFFNQMHTWVDILTDHNENEVNEDIDDDFAVRLDTDTPEGKIY